MKRLQKLGVISQLADYARTTAQIHIYCSGMTATFDGSVFFSDIFSRYNLYTVPEVFG